MKVLFFHRWVGVHGGGTETHLLELAKRFSQLGHTITILTREGERLTDLDKAIKVIRISKSYRETDHSYNDWRVYFYTLLFMFKSMIMLLKLKLGGERYDVISVHFVTEAVIARLYRWLFGVPFIFILEGYTPMEAQAAKFANQRIAISKYEAMIYKQRHGLVSKLIYIGIDFKKFVLDKERLGTLRSKLVKKGEFMILTVCRLEPRKDLLTLIKAADRIRKINGKIKFMIAGTGISKGEIEIEIKKRKLRSTVKMLGFVTDDELPYYYGVANLFLLTSKEEWFGIVFIEAMAAGLPIVATDVDACPEVVADSGLFFRKSDSVDLTNKLIEVVGDGNLRKTLANNSKKRSLMFDWEKQIRLYEKEYLEVIKND
ncbi:MAG: glycosyltransferase family 4 protein [Candidatus Shapirobacteria bacterium]|jgi:glycosyltransferase involved in cell wall biosynthesis